MEKAPDAFRTISEVADEIEVPQHVLRFWESRFAQIKPMKRGGSRRYYRPDDVDLLRGVRHLLYGEGYTIKGVQKLLKEQGAQAVARRHMEIMQSTMSGLTTTLKELSVSDSPANRAAKQTDLLKQAYENAVSNTRELGDLIQKSNTEAMEKLNHRFAEAMTEMKALFKK